MKYTLVDGMHEVRVREKYGRVGYSVYFDGRLASTGRLSTGDKSLEWFMENNERANKLFEAILSDESKLEGE